MNGVVVSGLGVDHHTGSCWGFPAVDYRELRKKSLEFVALTPAMLLTRQVLALSLFHIV